MEPWSFKNTPIDALPHCCSTCLRSPSTTTSWTHLQVCAKGLTAGCWVEQAAHRHISWTAGLFPLSCWLAATLPQLQHLCASFLTALLHPDVLSLPCLALRCCSLMCLPCLCLCPALPCPAPLCRRRAEGGVVRSRPAQNLQAQQAHAPGAQGGQRQAWYGTGMCCRYGFGRCGRREPIGHAQLTILPCLPFRALEGRGDEPGALYLCGHVPHSQYSHLNLACLACIFCRSR